VDPLGDTMDATLSKELANVKKGTVLAGRYEILDVLGAGGMGTVTRAHDRELDEIVALKILHGTFVDVAAFRSEVKLARRVTHRNVARTFELGEHHGIRFITMELVRGESLARILERRGALPAEEAVPILAGVCEGLAAAHAVSIVHRDIKPENVLVEETGRVVITDFGIAREKDIDGSRSQHVAGTPLYIAPELLEGKPIDARTDIYSLGVMAWEMLVGEPPWTGSPLVAMSRRLTEAPPDPRTKRPDLDPRLAEATLRCMARDPEGRFDDAIRTRDAFSGSVRKASQAPPPPTSARATFRTLAVLPFKHDGEEWIAEGVADDLVDALASIKGVRVLARSALAKESGDPVAIGKRHALGHVIEGTIRSAKMSVRLVEVATGFVAWAGKFELKESVLSAQDEIARAVAVALGLDRGAQRKAPSDAEALGLYLRARRHYHGFELNELRTAVGLLEDAVRRSPDNAVLQAGLSLAIQRRTAAGELDTSSWNTARDAADAAIRLAPDLGEAHFARAQLLLNTGDPIGAARAARVAIGNAPSLAEAHELLGRVLLESGRVEDAYRRFDVAERLDPALVHVTWERARFAALEDDWETFDTLRAKWEASQTHRMGRIIYDVRYAAWKRDEDALRKLRLKVEENRAQLGEGIAWIVTAMISGYLRETPLDEVQALIMMPRPAGLGSPRFVQWSGQLMGEISGYVGDRDRCAMAIASAAEAGLFDRVWLERCKLLEPARTDPRYAIALEQVRARGDAIVEAVWG
jgi:serine/threonine-protein kinase